VDQTCISSGVKNTKQQIVLEMNAFGGYLSPMVVLSNKWRTKDVLEGMEEYPEAMFG